MHELLTDLRAGHNVVATELLQCHAIIRAAGAEELRPVGETEFVAGIAAMCDSGIFGPIRVAAGIVAFADLTLGDRVEEILQAHINAGKGRFRGIRHSGGWDADPIIGNSFAETTEHFYMRPDFRAGLAKLTARGLSFDAWLYHPQLDELVDLARSFPSTNIIMDHCGCPLGYGPYEGRRDEVFAAWKKSMTALAQCPNVSMKLGGMMMRLAAYDYNAVPRAAIVGKPVRNVAALYRDLHRTVWRRTWHVRK